MDEQNAPIMYVFAGNNGSGKSTIRNLIAEKLGIGINIDPDSIARKLKFRGNVKPDIAAGREAISNINECIQNKKDFTMETTLAGNMSIRQMKTAKSKGFYVYVFYVSTNDVNINIKRIAQRLKNGGHHIPTEDVLRRKDISIKHLLENHHMIDHLQLIDNTDDSAEVILEHIHDHTVFQADCIPEWAYPISTRLNKK